MSELEHTYLVCYDICDPRRWRVVYKTMQGYGQWLQLSIFQCRLNRQNLLMMTDRLSELVAHDEDHLLIIDLGPSDQIELRVESIGRRFRPVEKKAVIV